MENRIPFLDFGYHYNMPLSTTVASGVYLAATKESYIYVPKWPTKHQKTKDIMKSITKIKILFQWKWKEEA